MSEKIEQTNLASDAVDQAADPARETLEQALSFHQTGQLAEAQALYKQVLKLQPNNFDALHLLGVIAVQTNHFEQAAALIGQAIEISQDSELAYYNYGIALQNLKRYETALDCFERAIALIRIMPMPTTTAASCKIS